MPATEDPSQPGGPETTTNFTRLEKYLLWQKTISKINWKSLPEWQKNHSNKLKLKTMKFNSRSLDTIINYTIQQ